MPPAARSPAAKSDPKEQSPFRVQWGVRCPERSAKAAPRPSVEAECHAGRRALKSEVAQDHSAMRKPFGGQERRCRMERIAGRQQTACARRFRIESIWVGI